jgi:hypothetical protein
LRLCEDIKLIVTFKGFTFVADVSVWDLFITELGIVCFVG